MNNLSGFLISVGNQKKAASRLVLLPSFLIRFYSFNMFKWHFYIFHCLLHPYKFHPLTWSLVVPDFDKIYTRFQILKL